MPKISVIVPIYNKEKYLEQCLKSIIHQSFKDLEIILVDDGSSDNSLMISEKFQKKDERIKIISQENQGVSIARNTGIENASGEFIGFVDPDDWIEKDMFLKMFEKCRETNSPVSISNYFKETSDKISIRELDVSSDLLTKREIRDQILSTLIGPLKVGEPTIMSSVWRLLIKRDLIIDNNIKFPKNIHRMQDLSFSIEIFIYANQVCVVEEPLYHYKVHDDSASVVYDINTFEQLIKILPIIEDILDKHNVNNDTKKRINNRYLYIGIKSISNEAHINNPNSFNKTLNNIKKICTHNKVQAALNNMDLDQYQLKEKMIFNSIKYKQAFILFSYYRLAQLMFR